MTVSREQDPQAVSRLLRALPNWFGVPAAVDNYVNDANTMTSYVAHDDGVVVGVALVRRHYPETSELHLTPVAPRRTLS